MSAIKYAGFLFEKYISKKLDIDSSVSMFDAKQISTTGFFILLSSIFTIGIGHICCGRKFVHWKLNRF